MSWYVNTWNGAIGPFDTAEAAATWGKDHLDNGVLTISRLIDPSSIALTAEKAGTAVAQTSVANVATQPAAEPEAAAAQTSDGAPA